jgi:hypothetical protein
LLGAVTDRVSDWTNLKKKKPNVALRPRVALRTFEEALSVLAFSSAISILSVEPL